MDEEDVAILIRRIPDEDLSVREIRICCPDALGLGVDLTRVILDFGLRIIHADISTDGSWCFLILKVQLSAGVPPRWGLLKNRLEQIVPTGADAIRSLWDWNSNQQQNEAYLLQVSGYDRQGMLHALSHALWEADTSVFKAHITTSSDGQVLDSFWLHDNRNELPEPVRVLEICDRVKSVLGPEAECTIAPAPLQEKEGGCRMKRMACKDASSRSNLRTAASTRRHKAFSSCDSVDLQPSTTVDPTCCGGRIIASTGTGDIQQSQISVEVDNDTSASFTMITIRCKDRKGLLYDMFRAFKEVDLKVAYTKLEALPDGICEADIFLQDTDGDKITDPVQLSELLDMIRAAVALPIKVEVKGTEDSSRTELTVTAGVDAGGRGRPRVTFDVTQGLNSFGVGIDTADVFVEDSGFDGELGGSPRELHKFIIHTPPGHPLRTDTEKKAMHDVICAALMGHNHPLHMMPPDWAPSQGGEEQNEYPLRSGHHQHKGRYSQYGFQKDQEYDRYNNNSHQQGGLLLRAMSGKWTGNNR